MASRNLADNSEQCTSSNEVGLLGNERGIFLNNTNAGSAVSGNWQVPAPRDPLCPSTIELTGVFEHIRDRDVQISDEDQTLVHIRSPDVNTLRNLHTDYLQRHLPSLLLDRDPDGMRASYICVHAAIAIWFGNLAAFRLLFEPQGGFQLAPTPEIFRMVMQMHNVDFLDALLQSGCNINDPEWRIKGVSPLATAAKDGHLDMLLLLLDLGADPCDEKALSYAAKSGDEFTKALLDRYKKRYKYPIRGFGIEAMKTCIKFKYYDRFAHLVESGLDVIHLSVSEITKSHNSTNWDYESVFGYAIVEAKDKDLRFVEAILERLRKINRNPNIPVWERKEKLHSALTRAITTGNTQLIQLLIQHGADVNGNFVGSTCTPLLKAVQMNNTNTSTAQLLINKGPMTPTEASVTPLQQAAMDCNNWAIMLLLKHGADVDRTSWPFPMKGFSMEGRKKYYKYHATALIEASRYGRTDTVKLLLNAGAASKGRDDSQLERAIALAKGSGFSWISDMLRSYRDRDPLVDPFFDVEQYLDDTMDTGG